MKLHFKQHFWGKFWQSRFGRVLRLVVSWQPLTGRGVTVLILATVGLRLFALPEYDLVADVLGTSALAILALTVLVAIVVRLRVASRLRCELRFDEGSALSRRPVASGIVLHGSSLPPFFSLRLTRGFVESINLANGSGAARLGRIESPVHVVRGGAAADEARHLLDGIVFPHRDLWAVDSVRCDLEDQLGLTRLTWFIPMQTGCEVSAETVRIAPLPVVAASSRAGDEQLQARERTGDLYDIKPYDPSDGIKRILWKTYAKSGQLVARRPEPAVIPDGEVILYLIAGPEDDVVAGACQGYVDQLIEHQVNVVFGTDGLRQTTTGQPVSSPEEIRHAINQTASAETAGTGKDFAQFLSSIQAADRFVQQVILFAPDRLGSGIKEGNSSWIDEVTLATSQQGLRLTVAVVPEELDSETISNRVRYRRALKGLPKSVERLPRVAKKTLGLLFPELKPLSYAPSEGKDLRAICAKLERAGAAVIIVEE